MRRREFLKTGAGVLGAFMMADHIFASGSGGRLAQAAARGDHAGRLRENAGYLRIQRPDQKALALRAGLRRAACSRLALFQVTVRGRARQDIYG